MNKIKKTITIDDNLNELFMEFCKENGLTQSGAIHVLIKQLVNSKYGKY